MKRTLATLCLLLCTSCAVAADTVIKDWTFSQAGNYLGWTTGNYSSTGVVAGYFWGNSSNTDPIMYGPSYTFTGNAQDFVEIKLRARYTSGETDLFGYTPIEVFWRRTSDSGFTGARSAGAAAFGNGTWMIYRIYVGANTSYWVGKPIKYLRVDPVAVNAARTEVAYIRIIRDTTVPTFTAKNDDSVADNETTLDTTPTIVLRDVYDDGTGISKIEVYRRPGSSNSDTDWVLAATVTNPTRRYQCTFPSLAAGTYDFSVKVYDKGGNCNAHRDSANHWIDNVTIDTGATTTVAVDPSTVVNSRQAKLTGNNIDWPTGSGLWDINTQTIPDGMEDRMEQQKMPMLRYPGGCFADVFYWKRSIGPQENRVDQYQTGITLYNAGPAKFGLDEFLRFCESRNMAPLLTVRFRWPGSGTDPLLNDPDPYPTALADAEDLVEYCNSPNDGSNPNGGTDWAAQRAANGHPSPYNVKYFEIGNEVWGNDPYGSTGNHQNGDVYAIHFLKFRERMKAVDSTIKVAFVTDVMMSGWTTPVWDGYAHPIADQVADAQQGHPYFDIRDAKDDTTYWQVMAGGKLQADRVFVEKEFAHYWSGGRTIPMWQTEWNNIGWIANTLMFVINMSDTFRVWSLYSDWVECANLWFIYAEADWGMLKAMGDVRAEYYPMLLYSARTCDNVVKARVTASPLFDNTYDGNYQPSDVDMPKVTAFATKSTDGSALGLILINKDKTTDRSVSVNLGNFTIPCDADIWTMNGPDVFGTTINITTGYQTYSSNPFTVNLPAHSVTSLMFRSPAQSVSTIGGLSSIQDGTRVRLTGKTVSGVLAGSNFYIQESDKSAGIKVLAIPGVIPVVGQTVAVSGVLGTDANGQRQITGESLQ
ncbi:MAG: hypothetical protein ACYC64_09485 [Armatimonadota bacterium]